jgi:hypothetical protein
VNVSQWSHDEKSFEIVVCTRVDRSAWDYRLFPNPHALTIYSKFVPAYGAVPKKFEKCRCKDDDICLHCQTWVLGDGHYRWLQGPINLFSMEHQVEYLACTIRRILDFL